MILRQLLPRCPQAVWQRRAGVYLQSLCSARSFSAEAETVAETSDSGAVQQPPVGFPYRINAALILERYQVITQDETEFEKKYYAWAEQIHIEKSKFSVREILDVEEAKREQEELEMLRSRTKGKKGKKGDGKGDKAAEGEGDEMDVAAEFAAARKEDQDKKKKKDVFVPASRVTEADRTNDRHSTARALQRTLYLVVRELPKKGSGGKVQWRFPQMERKPDENLRETSERVARMGLNRSELMRLYHIGNCPAVHVVGEHEPDADGFVGHKTFYFRAQWLEGPLSLPKMYSDYAWVTREELAEYLAPAQYDVIRQALRH